MSAHEGWRPLLGYDQVRFEAGRAVEVRLHVACADVGVGGHRCSRACAPATEASDAAIVTSVRRVSGEALTLGARVERDDERNPYTSWEYIALVR